MKFEDSLLLSKTLNLLRRVHLILLKDLFEFSLQIGLAVLADNFNELKFNGVIIYL